MKTLRNFFFKVLDLNINQTPSHKTNLPMKKNQSLSYCIDFDLNRDLFIQLTEFATLYPFIKIDQINSELVSISDLFPEYGKKPIPFKLLIDIEFKNLYYDYSEDRLYTFMNFDFGEKKYSLPIEKIAL